MEELTNSTFKEKTEKGLVIVDFFADWCGPCKSFAPIFEQTAQKFTHINFFKLNIENAQDIAAQYGVMSIPTVLFFKDGEIVAQKMGMMLASQFEHAIKEAFDI